MNSSDSEQGVLVLKELRWLCGAAAAVPLQALFLLPLLPFARAKLGPYCSRHSTVDSSALRRRSLIPENASILRSKGGDQGRRSSPRSLSRPPDGLQGHLAAEAHVRERLYVADAMAQALLLSFGCGDRAVASTNCRPETESRSLQTAALRLGALLSVPRQAPAHFKKPVVHD